MEENEKLNTEARAVDTLLQNGVNVPIATKYLRFIGVKKISFRLNEPSLGTLLYLSKIYLEIKTDETKFKDEVYRENYMMVPDNCQRVAKFVAVALLNNRTLIKVFSKPFGYYLLWRLKPSKLFQAMVLILMISNVQSFTNSIRLMETFRMMKPKAEQDNLSRDSTGV